MHAVRCVQAAWFGSAPSSVWCSKCTNLLTLQKTIAPSCRLRLYCNLYLATDMHVLKVAEFGCSLPLPSCCMYVVASSSDLVTASFVFAVSAQLCDSSYPFNSLPCGNFTGPPPMSCTSKATDHAMLRGVSASAVIQLMDRPACVKQTNEYQYYRVEGNKMCMRAPSDRPHTWRVSPSAAII